MRLSNLTVQELRELILLKDRLFGEDSFVVWTDDNPDCDRYNQLMLKTLDRNRKPASFRVRL